MSSLLRSMKRAIKRDEFKKENGHSRGYHNRLKNRLANIDMYKTIEKGVKRHLTLKERIKNLLKRKKI